MGKVRSTRWWWWDEEWAEIAFFNRDLDTTRVTESGGLVRSEQTAHFCTTFGTHLRHHHVFELRSNDEQEEYVVPSPLAPTAQRPYYLTSSNCLKETLDMRTLLLPVSILLSIAHSSAAEDNSSWDCHFSLSNPVRNYDLTSLSGLHTVQQTRETPPSRMIEHIRFDVCKPLAREDGVSDVDQVSCFHTVMHIVI